MLTERLELPAAAEIECLIARGVACIMLIYSAAKPRFTSVRIVRNPAHALTTARREWNDARVAWIVWAHGDAEAKAVLARADIAPPGVHKLSPDVVRERIECAADEIGIVLTDNSTVLAATRNQALAVSRFLEDQRENGGLHFFNERYRQYRLAAMAANHSFMSYNQALGLLRQWILRAGPADALAMREKILQMFKPKEDRAKMS